MGLKKPPLSVVTEGEFLREGEGYFVFETLLTFTGGQKWSVNPPTLQPQNMCNGNGFKKDTGRVRKGQKRNGLNH